ncbi:MAG TPA: polysaccharide biosynthesis C-terminal domain-containing protein [Polyangiales bacterium]|nr:polysaccharide biosynthesis C-terminal domain-containing protein [Polyangiales bacterium]
MAYQAALLKGTLVNTLGLMTKLLYPLLIFVLTRLFGAGLMGHYFIALAVVELGTGAVTSGWATATTVRVSPHAEAAGDDAEANARMNAMLGRTLSYSLATALLFGLLVQGLGSWTIHNYFTKHVELLPGIYFVGWAMVPTAFANIVGAAGKAHLKMAWDAILGGARPLFLLVTSVLVYFLGGGLTELLASYFLSMFAVALLSLIPLVRYFDFREVLRNVRPVWDGELVHFAVPEGLTHTLTLYITRLDTIMLGAMGVEPVTLAWYATASYVTSNLQQLRIVFSTALAPVVARHHYRREREELTPLLTRTTRWVSSILLLFALSFVVLRRDILAFVDRSYARPGDGFVLVLLIPAVVSCGFGLAGNFITYTGHSRVNLVNGIFIGALNTMLNLLWIPPYGLMGAACATAVSATIVGILTLIELRVLENITIRGRDAWMPYAGAAVGAAILGLFWDPADFRGLGARLLLTLAVLVAYGVGLWVSGHPEVRAWVRRQRPARHPLHRR